MMLDRVRQGVWSPNLSNIISELVMQKALEGYEGVHIGGGRTISNLRYVDDIVLIATSRQELRELLIQLSRTRSEYMIYHQH